MSDKYEDDSAIIDGLRETLAEIREENTRLRATLRRTEESLREEMLRHQRLFDAKAVSEDLARRARAEKRRARTNRTD